MNLFKNILETVWVLGKQPFYKRDLSTRRVWDPGRPSWNPWPTLKKGTNVSDIVTQQEPSQPRAVFSSMLYSPGKGERYILDQCKLGIFSSRCSRLRGLRLLFIGNSQPGEKPRTEPVKRSPGRPRRGDSPWMCPVLFHELASWTK